MKRTVLISLVGLFSTSMAVAACKQQAIEQVPSVPAGESATLEQMLSAQKNIQTYVSQAESHIGCIYNTFRYNLALKQIRNVANNYNSQLKIFKAKES
jgi:hypothetical protein